MTDLIDKAAQTEQLQRDNAIAKAREHGTHGTQRERDGYIVCIECDEPIALPRLQQLPHATRCVQCQTLIENRSVR